MSFIYVSGQGTDSSERGGSMWARVKGKTENDLLALGFMAVYIFRPGLIQLLHGIQSKTKAYRIFYSALGPLMPLLKKLFPKNIRYAVHYHYPLQKDDGSRAGHV